MKVNLKVLFVLISFLLIVSCDKKQVFDSYQPISNSWHRDSIVSFEFEVQDTLTPYNLFLNIRANNNYPFSNIFLITSLESPNQQIKVDTLEYLMAAPDGRLLGNGFSDLKESKLWYKQNYRFSETGKHTLRIEHAMRKRNEVEGIEALEGVSDVGFRIENIN